LQGHLTEALLLFLAREAGHKVEHEQKEVYVLGVPGHIDSVIDGCLTDVKTASQFGYKKFADNTLHLDDPFGYLAQISCYKKGLEDQGISTNGAVFWAYNKSNSDMCLTRVTEDKLIDAEKRIAEQKSIGAVAEVDELPLCYPDEPFGKSGNMQVNKNCLYCPFLDMCRTDARKFEYADGVKYLTTIESQPRVREIV
jgi:hypothetical protein